MASEWDKAKKGFKSSVTERTSAWIIGLAITAISSLGVALYNSGVIIAGLPSRVDAVESREAAVELRLQNIESLIVDTQHLVENNNDLICELRSELKGARVVDESCPR